MAAVAIFTSIPPRLRRLVDGIDIGESYQRQCVDSWLATQCPVYSVNSRAELDLLHGRIANVTFVPIATADHSGGTLHLPAVSELFRVMSDRGHPVNIYLNADILLLPKEAVAEFVARQAKDGLLLFNRTDIASLGARTAVVYHGNFDVIGIGRELLAAVDMDGFRLGEPWWDYWLPACAILKGFPVRRHDGIIGYHLKHPKSWKPDVLMEHGLRFITMLRQLLAKTDIARLPPARRLFVALAKQALFVPASITDDKLRYEYVAKRFGGILNNPGIVPAVKPD